MVDLGGDGLALVDLAASPVRFDTLALGLPFPTAWLQTKAQGTATNDAFVVVDRNGDGQITSISEMLSEYFGSSDGRRTATSGLDALAQFDTNLDGQIDLADRDWTRLKLWFDHGAPPLPERPTPVIPAPPSTTWAWALPWLPPWPKPPPSRSRLASPWPKTAMAPACRSAAAR